MILIGKILLITMKTIFQYENGIIKLKRFTLNIEIDNIFYVKYVKCNELF